MHSISALIFILYIATRNERSFVSTAAVPQIETSQNTGLPTDSNERELESLKDQLDKTLEMVNTHSSSFTRTNEQTRAYSDRKEIVNQNGELVASVEQRVESQSNNFNEHPVARIQTDIEIPSEGVHKSVVQEITPERPKKPTKKAPEQDISNKDNEIQTLPGIQYTPYDMAEYVFWTGDEKGVTSAVEEFLREGLMSREQAISFLQEIKDNLDYLETRYNQLGLNLQEKYKELESNMPKYYPNMNFQRESLLRSAYSQNSDITRLKKEVKKIPSESSDFKKEENNESSRPEDYDELLEKLKVADFLYTEYSLEEVIYQLAKIMFKQSLAKESSEAQQALHKFIMFLETEAEQGHISRTLEKKVLDVLIAALTDTLTQYPELVAKAKESPSSTYSEKQEVLQKILELSPETNVNLPSDITYKIATDKSNAYQGHTKASNLKYTPLGYGKYNS